MHSDVGSNFNLASCFASFCLSTSSTGLGPRHLLFVYRLCLVLAITLVASFSACGDEEAIGLGAGTEVGSDREDASRSSYNRSKDVGTDREDASSSSYDGSEDVGTDREDASGVEPACGTDDDVWIDIGLPPEREFGELGIYFEPGTYQEEPFVTPQQRYGEPTFLFFIAESLLRWDGVNHTSILLLSAETNMPLLFTGVMQSPTGDDLLVTSAESLYVIPIDKGDAVEIATSAVGKLWLPDGERIVYSTSDGLFVVRRDGSNDIAVTDRIEESHERIFLPSPDSAWIALTQINHVLSSRDDCDVALSLIATDGIGTIELSNHRQSCDYARQTPAKWSGDGRFIAFFGVPALSDFGDATAISVFDTQKRQLTVLPGCAARPKQIGYAWNPEAAQLAFIDPSANETRLRLFDAVNNEQIDLGVVDERPNISRFDPYWAPYGERVSFCTDTVLWQSDLDAAPPRLISDYGRCYVEPLSPSGDWAAKMWPRYAVNGIVRILSTRGTQALELDVSQPYGWSSDGSRFAYGTGADELIVVAPSSGVGQRFEPVDDDDDVKWLFPDLIVVETEQIFGFNGGLYLFDLATGKTDYLQYHSLRTATRPTQRAFCALAVVDATIMEEDYEDFWTIEGTGTEQLVLFYQDQPGGAWQQRVLDERPNEYGNGSTCYIP